MTERCSRPALVAMPLIATVLLAAECDAPHDEPGPGDASHRDGGPPTDAWIAALDGGAAPVVDAGEAPRMDASGDRDAGVPPSLPADVFDLSIWKLTLPVGAPEEPREILQPELATYELDPYFVVEGTAVRFRAHVGGVTTSGSSYPRSELREMEADGTTRAGWSTTEGHHSMRIEQAITHLPEVKPHVVAGQIHDASDDVVMIRLEGRHLFVEGDGEELGTLDDDYVLGERFVVRIEASEGRIRIDHGDDGSVEVELELDTDGCYFKAGAYTQSSPDRGDEPDAYGEVQIHALEVTHTD